MNQISNNRIEYIDALRGIAMLLVVFQHIATFGYETQTPINGFLMTFRMPLFYFIGGFIAYKTISKSINKSLISHIYHKSRALLIPPLIFGTLYAYIYCQADFFQLINSVDKLGYWFPLVLWEMYILFYFALYINHKICRRLQMNNLWLIIMLIGTITLTIAKFPLKTHALLYQLGNLTSAHLLCSYFQFFCFGLFCSKFHLSFHKILNIPTTFAICFLGLLSLYYIKVKFIIDLESYSVNIFKFIRFACDILCGYMGIIITYSLVKNQQAYISRAKKLGRFLQFLGKRTMDVYLIHYFILPHIPSIGQHLLQQGNIIIELLISIPLAIAITCLCLFIGVIIRSNTILAYLFLGVKAK